MNNICSVPFFRITFHHDIYGRENLAAVPCCGSWLKYPYSTFSIPVKEDTHHNVDVLGAWNSIEMKRFRASILNGSYEFCKKDTCPHLVSNTFPEFPNEALPYISKKETHLNYPPLSLVLGIDRACNLKCPACRGAKEPLANKKTYQRTSSFLNCGAKVVMMNASGELFINRYMMKVLQEFSFQKYPAIECINIMTNGTCFNKTTWSSISDDAKKLIGEVSVSLDSPNKETYESIRIGGNHSITMRNMEFISQLRQQNFIKKLTLVCVVQKKNVHELLDFISYSVKMKADILVLNKIEQWGHVQDYHFNKHMALPENWQITYKDSLEKSKSLLNEHNIRIMSNIILL